MENKNLVDISEYEGLYKFDTELQQVYNIKRNRYLKNRLECGNYRVKLYKNGKDRKILIRDLIKKPENPNLVDIPDYEGLYKFDKSNNQVFGIRRNEYIKCHKNTGGYYFVTLSKNNISQVILVNRLVYMCHNPQEDINLFEIDYIDCDKLNNNIENLRKATRSENKSNNKTCIDNKLGLKNIRQTKSGYEFHLQKNKIHYRRYFKTLQETVTYRDKFVLEKCGEFSNLG